ncbi:MAG: N-acetylmuramoyl-L-alanine amidase, partial [Oscillochloris sp.]|nr:N-acetylmuramoyl-L-alanine amidase [Oscillochloris sp.]
MIRHRLTLLLISCCLIALTILGPASPGAAESQPGRPSQVLLDPAQPASTPSLDAFGYLSPITQASPFSHLLLRWQADLPSQSAISLEVRASLDSHTWTDWSNVSEDDTLWQPTDGPNVHWSATLYAGEGARFWQVRASFMPAPDGSLPVLGQIAVNTVDARFGPQSPTASPSLASVGKPTVVSRTAWGNPDGQSSQADPDYYPVNHLVIHHTADANSLVGSETSWADRVRAEWSFHTYTRGWGDIGY